MILGVVDEDRCGVWMSCALSGEDFALRGTQGLVWTGQRFAPLVANVFEDVATTTQKDGRRTEFCFRLIFRRGISAYYSCGKLDSINKSSMFYR